MICARKGDRCPTGTMLVADGDLSPLVRCSPETASLLGAVAENAATSNRCTLQIADQEIALGHVQEFALIVGGNQ